MNAQIETKIVAKITTKITGEHKMSAKIITHTNGKGGVGKTTLNQLTSILLSRSGKKVLMIDLDPNCCLSQIYGKEFEDETSENLIHGNYATPINVAENLDLIPSTLRLSYLNNFADLTIKNMLKKYKYIEQYDFIILDPPGTWSGLTRTALSAATDVIIPATMSNLDFQATKLFFEQVLNMFLDAEIKIICNRSNTQKNEPQIFEKFVKEFNGREEGDYLMPCKIPDIPSLKKLTSDATYELVPSVKKGLGMYVQMISE